MIIYIINAVIRDQQAASGMVAFTLFMGIFSILKGIFDLYKCKIHTGFVYEGMQKLSEQLYELLLKEDLMNHNRKDPMQALALVRSDTLNCMNIIVNCTDICIHILTLVGYFVVLMYTSKWLGIVSSIFFIVFMSVMFFYYRNQIRVYGEQSRKYVIKTNAQVTIAYGNFKEIKIADNSNISLRRYHDASEKYAQIQKKFQSQRSMLSMVMQNFVMMAIFIVLAVFLWSPGRNLNFLLASMVVYLTMLIKMIPIAYGVVSGLNDVKFSQKSYEELREGIERYLEIKEAEAEKKKIRQKKITFQRGLYVHNLTFAYNEQREIFRDASIDIPVGCSVAIIGISGSGKTTFLDLILGLLMPQSGNILYDDYDIVSHSDEEGICRANIGDIASYIPQVVYLNGESICNNVGFFAEENEIDINRVIECLKCAQIWEDVMQMSEGIHTLVGENGTFISGGQRQRIALARALYKDFELLVMDEATAALDMETEMAVIDSIRQIKGNKTILLATHHMSLANECDMIYKIHNFQLVRVK